MAISKKLFQEIEDDTKFIYTKKAITIKTYDIMIEHYQEMINKLEEDKDIVMKIGEGEK